jgi:uncharacterized protein YjbI with pentapeptide repeats
MIPLIATAISLVLLTATSALSGVSSAPEANPAATWANVQVQNHHDVDFNSHCAVTLDPLKDGDNPRWTDPCRTLAAAELEAILLAKNESGQRIRIVGARIVGDVNLKYDNIENLVQIARSRFDGNLTLSRAVLSRAFMLDYSRVKGTVEAISLDAKSDVGMRGTVFEKPVNLARSTFKGGLDIENSNFCSLNISYIKLSRDLLLNGHATIIHGLRLDYSVIGGNAELEASTFKGEINGEALRVSGSVFLGKSIFSKGLNFPYLNVKENIDFSGATLNKVDLSGAVIGDELRLHGTFGIATWHSSNGEANLITLRNA